MNKRFLSVWRVIGGQRPASVVLAVVFILFSLWRWKVILMSCVSLLLVLLVFVGGGTNISQCLRPGLFEYWLAAFVWMLMAFLFGKRYAKILLGSGNNMSGGSGCSEPANEEGARFGHPAVLVLLSYVFVAMMAPLLAPHDPTAQGDLRTTRLLKPLESRVTIGKTPLIEKDGPEMTSAFVPRMLEHVNGYLLQLKNPYAHHDAPMPGALNEHDRRVEVFFLGTDDLGRDVFSRVIYGLRISVLIGTLSVACSILIASLVGFVAGIQGGWIDHVLMRITDLFIAVPSLFLVISLVAFFGNSTTLLVLVLGTTGWMGVARIIRGEVAILNEREFISASRLLGRSSLQIVRDHMIPNLMPAIVVAMVLQLGNVILAEAALSFLGLGIQPPTPSLGNMIGESLPYLRSAWWVGIFPGIILSALVVQANLVGERLQNTGRNRA